jgi:predicted DNA binding CopG/RHH family protein
MKKPVPECKDNKEIEIERPVKRPVTLRLYPYLIDGIKDIAQKRSMPYQTLIGYWLSEKLSQEQLLELQR